MPVEVSCMHHVRSVLCRRSAVTSGVPPPGMIGVCSRRGGRVRYLARQARLVLRDNLARTTQVTGRFPPLVLVVPDLYPRHPR